MMSTYTPEDPSDDGIERMPSGVPKAPKGSESRVRIAHLAEMKRTGRPIAMVTAYDSTFASIADEAGIDVILVGDSVGMVMHGLETTLPVTMEMMVLHTAAVTRVTERAFVVADMPFLSYQVSPQDAVRNAGRLVQEGGAHGVKVEVGGAAALDAIRAIVDVGIPVMGHVGLVPQSVHQLSGFRKQGKTEPEAKLIRDLARAQVELGVFSLVIESVPEDLAAIIAKEVRVPCIGIGAGNAVDGQVLVMHDILGLLPHSPPFAKKYLDLRAGALRAFRKYGRDVRERLFPPAKPEGK
jgi:3-methyl-2-oxobutanoate hydroxymethyltransferase